VPLRWHSELGKVMKTTLRIFIVTLFIAGIQLQAAPVFKGAATAVGKNSVIALEKPAGTQAGDLLVAALMLEGGHQINVDIPPGWTKIRRANKYIFIGIATYYRIAGASEPASYSFPLDESTPWAASISRISGADLDDPIEASGKKNGRRGNGIAPSITTREDDALVLAFYTSRRNATYTPHAATAEQYDAPNNPEGLPSNMLATFVKETAGATGDKSATSTRTDRRWIALQIAVADSGEAPSFNIQLVPAGNKTIGELFMLDISGAKDANGTLLDGSVGVAVASPLDGLIFNKNAVFTDGSATLVLSLTSAASHTLTIGVAGISQTQSLTLTVTRRPVTLTADSGQSKIQNESDPVLTWTFTAGSPIEGIPLSGEPSRDSGEAVGFYPIHQGSLTGENNPSYAITFVSADFEVISPEPPPPPATSGIWTSAEELAGLPMSGDPWNRLKDDADTYWGIPNLSDQEDKGNIYAMSKALVYARTGIESYRTDVIEACMQIIGSEEGGRVLALARNLAAFVIAADLVGLPADDDAVFRNWLETVPFEELNGGTLISAHESKADNQGAHAGASRAAVAAYLNDQDELDRIAQVFKGWLGDRSSYNDFSYGDPYWQADPSRPVGINPAGSTIQGHDVDGVLPDEQRKAGEFIWPPPKRSSVYESLQGALLQAVILHRAGYDVWNWEDQALLRTFEWLHDVADYPSEGDDTWQPFLINYYYGTDFPAPTTSISGKNVARTCWTHSDPGSDPGPDPDPRGDLDFYPGDYSDAMVIGNSLPGTWRPFSEDSPWNTPIPDEVATHPDSEQIMNFVNSRVSNIRFVALYLTPIWVVNTDNALPVGTEPDPDRSMDLHWVHIRSDKIFDTWDTDRDGWSDVPIPLAKGTYPEPTSDGHICIVDPFRKVSYEMSRHPGWESDPPRCTTFNIWDLTGTGVGNPFEGNRWGTRGGKGSGFPLIAGILRPEELQSGEIRHALTFSFEQNRRASDGRDIMMWPPSCRSDGQYIGSKYPIEGMRFQLDPSLTEADFNQWGLTAEGKILARALQKYGMFLGDNGGDMAVSVQLLGTTQEENRAEWDRLFPNLYKNVKRIPSDKFRVVYTGEPTTR